MSEAGSAPRLLGVWSSLSIVAGAMIGVGLFIYPPVVAQLVADPSIFLLLWVFGGLTAQLRIATHTESSCETVSHTQLYRYVNVKQMLRICIEV